MWCAAYNHGPGTRAIRACIGPVTPTASAGATSQPPYAPSARTRPLLNRNTMGAVKTAIMVMSQK